MTKEELILFKSKTPREYIDNSLKCGISSGRKAHITRLWLEKNKKFTIDDIKYARNRHPYWKEVKMEGSLERNLQRQREHDYSYRGGIEWNEKTIKKFLDLNGKDSRGKYLHHDFQIARKFNTTIPAIQHYRRKLNLTMRILERLNRKPTEKLILEYIMLSEKLLREALKSMKKKR